MNSEGYSDPTADRAVKRADRPPQRVIDAIHVMRAVADVYGYDITNRIHLKDRKSGREYK